MTLRLSVRVKLYLITAVFVLVIGVLVAVAATGMHILWGVGAWVAGESLWSKSQKEAVSQLLRYARSHDDADYRRFLTLLEVPLADRRARLELEKPHPDYRVVYSALAAGRNHPDDLEIIAWIFVRFRHLERFERVIDLWIRGDAGVDRLLALGDELRRGTARASLSADATEGILAQVDAIDAELSSLAYEFSSTLGEAARWTARALLFVLLAVTLLFLALAIWIVTVISRDLRRKIERLQTGASRVADGDLSHRIPLESGDEIGRVTLAFNQMTEKLAATREERRLAGEALQESERRLRSLTESASDAIISADSSGRIVSWNRGSQSIFGYRADEVLGESVLVLMPERFRAMYREGVGGGPAGNGRELFGRPVEGEGLRKDGSEFPLEVSLATWNIGDKTFYGAIVRDLTERKALEGQLRQAQKLEVVGQLAGGLAHDFNNLLAVIIGRSQLLRARLGREDRLRRHAELIEETAQRGAGLTRRILAFGRKQVAQPQVLDLNALVAGMSTLLRQLVGDDVELTTELQPDLGWVNADPGQIEQVIMNLVLNARDALAGGGRLTIETANRRLDEAYAARHPGARPGEHVMLAVRDTGRGMAPATQARLFEPFFTTKADGKGTGLGLFTVYGIVSQSGGHIRVESEPDRGTTFTIYLPVHLPRVDAPGETVEPSVSRPAPARGSEVILLVEDRVDVRDMTREILEEHGYSVLVATHGREALSVSDRHQDVIHLLLTDVVMPQMRGPELAQHLMRRRPGLRVLYMSAYTDGAPELAGVLNHGTAFLQKPFAPDGLVRAVRQLLDGTEGARLPGRGEAAVITSHP
jgi:PAS domain S-box-containing protein